VISAETVKKTKGESGRQEEHSRSVALGGAEPRRDPITA